MVVEALKKFQSNRPSFVTLLGVTIKDFREGYAEGELEIKPEFKNAIGSVHGGCIFSLADTIASAAAASHDDYVTTSSADMHYLAAAINCSKLIARSTEIKNGRRLSVCDVLIFNEHEQLLAKGTFSFIKIDKK